MLLLQHAHVMSLLGVCVAVNSSFIIMPFMTNGSVLKFVKNHQDELLCTTVMESKVEYALFSGKGIFGKIYIFAQYI